MDVNSTRVERKLNGNCTRAVLNKSWRKTSYKATAVWTHLENHPKLREQDIQDTAGEVRTSSWAMYSRGLLHTNEKGLGDQLESIYNSSILIQDVAWKTCREWWTIGISGGRGSEKSVLAAHDDDDDKVPNFKNSVTKNMDTKQSENKYTSCISLGIIYNQTLQHWNPFIKTKNM